MLTMNPMGKTIAERNTTSGNVPYLVSNENCMCRHGKFHPLISRKGKWISETMYRDIVKIIQQDTHKYITSEGREGLSSGKSINCEIDYDLFCCPDCTESLCLDIKKKMNVLEKLCLLVRTLDMNYENQEKCYGISTNFIIKLTDLFLVIIGENHQPIFP